MMLPRPKVGKACTSAYDDGAFKACEVPHEPSPRTARSPLERERERERRRAKKGHEGVWKNRVARSRDLGSLGARAANETERHQGFSRACRVFFSLAHTQAICEGEDLPQMSKLQATFCAKYLQEFPKPTVYKSCREESRRPLRVVERLVSGEDDRELKTRRARSRSGSSQSILRYVQIGDEGNETEM